MRRREIAILIVLIGFLTALPLKAYATPDIGIWPSYGGDFGIFNVEQGSGPSDTRKVWIKNEGTSDLTVTNISSPAAPFSLVSPPAVPFTLTPGAEKDINIQFNPVSQGTYNSSLVISSNDPDEPNLEAPLTGIADEEPVTTSPGNFVTGEIKVILADTDIFYFYGKQNDKVHITTATQKDYTPFLDPRWELYDPSGTLVDYMSFGGSKTVTLPATGTYTILIRDWSNSATGQYGLSLNGVSASLQSGKNIGFAQTYVDEIEAIGDTDTFLFTGVQDDTVYITTATQKDYTPFLDPRWELYDPSGTLVDYMSFGGSKTVTLPTTGTYTILIRDWNNSATGQYGLSLQCISCTQLRYEENDPAISYTGTWNSLSCPSCSDGALKYSNQTGARVDFAFNGTGIKWIVAKAKMLGKAKVYLDGVYMGMVDLYSSTPKYQVVLQKTGLASGPHSVTIEVSGQKNPSSTGYYIDIDAFEVLP